MKDITYALAIFAVVIAIIMFWPFIFIWALNTLFPTLAIPFTFWTWLATLIIVLPFVRTTK